MDKDVKEANGVDNSPLIAVEAPKVEDGMDDGDDYSELTSLLPPRSKRDGMSRNPDKVRKVQWNDNIGNKLVDILEFEPSEASDSDEEDADSCICTIM